MTLSALGHRVVARPGAGLGDQLRAAPGASRMATLGVATCSSWKDLINIHSLDEQLAGVM